MRKLTEAASAVEAMFDKKMLGYLLESNGNAAKFTVSVVRKSDDTCTVSLSIHEGEVVAEKEMPLGIY